MAGEPPPFATLVFKPSNAAKRALLPLALDSVLILFKTLVSFSLFLDTVDCSETSSGTDTFSLLFHYLAFSPDEWFVHHKDQRCP